MESRDFFRVIRKRKWVIIVSAVVVTLVAVGVSAAQPKQYAGVSHVLVAEQGTSAATAFDRVLPGLSSQPERALQTEAQLMQQRPIAEATIKALNLNASPKELMERVTVVEVGQTNVVKIVATDRDAETAAMIANSIAQGYVTQSQDARRKSIAAAVKEVELRSKELKRQTDVLRRKVAAAQKSEALSADVPTRTVVAAQKSKALVAELQAKAKVYSTLVGKLEQLRISGQLETGAGTIVSHAVPDLDPVSPKPLLTGALALAVGLAFGVVVALALEYIEDTKSGT